MEDIVIADWERTGGSLTLASPFLPSANLPSGPPIGWTFRKPDAGGSGKCSPYGQALGTQSREGKMKNGLMANMKKIGSTALVVGQDGKVSCATWGQDGLRWHLWVSHDPYSNGGGEQNCYSVPIWRESRRMTLGGTSGHLTCSLGGQYEWILNTDLPCTVVLEWPCQPELKSTPG